MKRWIFSIGLVLLSVLAIGQSRFHFPNSAHLSAADDGIPDVLQNSDSTWLWLEADASNWVTDTRISQWNDLSGNGNHVTQNDAANQPDGDGDTVYFDGTNYYFDALEDTGLDLPVTVYAVLKQITWTQYEYFFGGYTGSTILIGQNGVATPDIIAYNGSASDPTSDAALNERHLFRVVFNGASSSFYMDGVAVDASGDFGSGDPNGVSVGRNAGGNSSNFSLSALIIMNGVNSSANISAIETYLNNKYGL